MKKFLLCLALGTIIAVMVQPKYSHGSTQQPPLARTGAPGEMSCATSGCHAGVATQNSPNITITLGSGIDTYQAGQTYNMSISNAATGSKYGFEMVALDANNNSVGVFTGNAAQNTNVSTSTSNNRAYIRHFNATTTPTYNFQWQAPSTNVGIIRFYAACNAANGNGLGTGDAIHLKTLAIDFATDIDNAPNEASPSQLLVYPNPLAGSNLWLAYRLGEAQNIGMEIYDMQGKLMEQIALGYQTSGEHQYNHTLDRSRYCTGTYIVNIKGKKYLQKSQIIVQ